jgi:hypothetical protein
LENKILKIFLKPIAPWFIFWQPPGDAAGSQSRTLLPVRLGRYTSSFLRVFPPQSGSW